MRRTSQTRPMASAVCTTRITFRHAQVVRTVHHIAPAGPACLNNNASFRRGRPSPFTRTRRVALSALVLPPEAIRS